MVLLLFRTPRSFLPPDTARCRSLQADKRCITKITNTAPPLSQQRKITAILSTWDEAIQTAIQLLKAKQERKRGLMQQLLSGKKRLPGFSEEWYEVKSGEIFKNISIKNHPNEELLSATQDRGVIPRSMLEGRVAMPESETKAYKLVKKGNFLISLRSFQGGIEYSEYQGIVSPAYTVLTSRLTIDEGFYKHYFKSGRFIRKLGVAIIGIRDGKQISFDDFSVIKIPQPVFQEQCAIAAVLNAADDEIRLAKVEVDALKQQKRGLMQELLTGKTMVKVEEEEHQSDLLKSTLV
ncbi:restriction endonuclease subunit S [Spirosoma sp. HMF3257]|uniref:Restriction endonuclease subunit S n=1 Tax=Spirosoma telluris TaxID=2183553 RepID=A0A327NGT5_9BACT|nr:restriction endonuclease subunit S [Spirosoma telluris]RAI73156.1 restriction endonuclease subunit S [Spirosoma telluris]